MNDLSYFTAGDGCRLAWRFDGPVGAPVLLLSNSLGTRLQMWDAQMDAFTEKFRVLRYDSRGHGASGVSPGAYSMDRLGRDVLEMLDFLQLERVHFCGLSKGGMVGQWLGLRAPERVDRLILCNTSSYMGPPSSWDARIKTISATGMAGVTDAVLERWFTPHFRATQPNMVEVVQKMLLATDPQGYTGCCAAIRDMDMRRLIRLIDRPTLILAGDNDPATPIEHSEALRDGIPNARLEVLAAAHLSNMEQPDRFAQIILNFL